MLNKFISNNETGSIRIMDIGASGQLDPKWQKLSPLIDLTGFEPNIDECERLSKQQTTYKKVNYLPYAISGKSEKRELKETYSPYCWSLLNPNSDWLNRFSFSYLFEIQKKRQIQTFALNEIVEITSSLL